MDSKVRVEGSLPDDLEWEIYRQIGCLTKTCCGCSRTFVCLPFTPGVSGWKCGMC